MGDVRVELLTVAVDVVVARRDVVELAVHHTVVDPHDGVRGVGERALKAALAGARVAGGHRRLGVVPVVAVVAAQATRELAVGCWPVVGAGVVLLDAPVPVVKLVGDGVAAEARLRLGVAVTVAKHHVIASRKRVLSRVCDRSELAAARLRRRVRWDLRRRVRQVGGLHRVGGARRRRVRRVGAELERGASGQIAGCSARCAATAVAGAQRERGLAHRVAARRCWRGGERHCRAGGRGHGSVIHTAVPPEDCVGGGQAAHGRCRVARAVEGAGAGCRVNGEAGAV